MDPIYLDCAATTPMREEVQEAMAPYLSGVFGNPSSMHSWGRAAAGALEDARAEAAAAIGAKHSEVYFVRGGTESDNIALQGACQALSVTGAVPALVVSAIEHSAVREASQHLAQAGRVRLTVLEVAADGSIDLDRAREALARGPALMSVMWVNNETGIVLPVPELASMAGEAGAMMHTDAVQAVGKVPVDVREVAVAMLSASGHKLYGPKSTGILFVRSGTHLSPLIHGGGQERSLRPGTQDVAGAVGMARALRLAVEEREAEVARVRALREAFEGRLLAAIPRARVSGSGAVRAPHISHLGIPDVPGDTLLMGLDMEGIAASGGSACSSGSNSSSHVVAALYGPDDGHAHVRFSLGRMTRAGDLDRAVAAVLRVLDRVVAA